jgi:hypothetical protein
MSSRRKNRGRIPMAEARKKTAKRISQKEALTQFKQSQKKESIRTSQKKALTKAKRTSQREALKKFKSKSGVDTLISRPESVSAEEKGLSRESFIEQEVFPFEQQFEGASHINLDS